MKENGDGANTIPEQDGQIIESLSFSAEKVESLLSFFRYSEILDVLNDGCEFLLIVGVVGFVRIGEGRVVLSVEVGRIASHKIDCVGVHYFSLSIIF